MAGAALAGIALVLLAQTEIPAPRPVLPGIGAEDHRAPVNGEAMPWRAIGRVQTELGSRCTGFLTGPSTMMTAAHCLFNHRTDRFMRPAIVHFVTGYAGGSYAGHATGVAMAIGPGYDPHHPQESLGADWAVITLSAPLGGDNRVLGLDSARPSPGTTVALGGYEQDRAEIIIADQHCALGAETHDGAGRRLLRHYCAGTRGTSGAPVLVHGANGVWKVVAIQVAAINGEAAGFAIPVDGLNLAAAKPVAVESD